MIIPIGLDAHPERRGYVTYVLVGLCALIFAWQLSVADEEGAGRYMAWYNVAEMRERAREEIKRELGPKADEVSAEELDAGIEAFLDKKLAPEEWDWTRRPWTLLTCAFLHGDLWHVLGNLLFLFIFGRAVNGRAGHGSFLGVYLFAAVASSYAHILFSGSAPGALLGASGAISAVMGMALAFFPRHRVRMFVWIFRFARVVEVRAFWAILYWFGYDLVMVLFVAKGSGVAVMAHVAGYAVGFAAGMGLLASGLVRPDGWDLLSTFRGRAVGRGFD